MLGKLLIFATLAVVQARPQVDSKAASAHDLCPDDEIHHLLPHEYDCTKFYYCEYGMKWEEARDCAPGTEFSYELQVCVHPVQANCTLPGVPPPEEGTPVEPEIEQPDTVEPEPEVVEPAPEVEPEPEVVEPEPEVVEPEPEVVKPEPEVVEPEPEVIEPEPEVEPEPETDEPEPEVTKPEPEVDPEEPGSEDQEVENPETVDPESNSGEQNATEWLANGCPADIHIHWLLPHESDCSKFYYCVFGEKQERNCSGGLHFNPILQVCDWPENAGCANGGQPGVVDPEVEEPGVVDPETGGPTTVDPESDSGEQVEWLENGCPADFHIHWLLPHESDCGKFYYCVFGDKEERTCSGGLHFNPILQVCDWPENAGCANGGQPGVVDPEVEEPGVVDPETDRPTTVVPESDSGEVVEWLENGCPADFHIHWLLPHESDCGKFYYCVFGDKQESSCSGGLHFNPVLQVCDWPENAGCANAGVDPEVEEPEIVNPEVEEPDSVDPEVEEPESVDPEVEEPEDVEPEVEEPESVDPDVVDPEVVDPEVVDPDVVDPEVVDPDVVDPDIIDPEVVDPEVEEPEALDPEEPEVEGPEIEEPEVVEPEDVDPDAEEPGALEPETEGPTTVGPESESGEEAEWLENGCPADFHIHWLLPHESDCGKFYYCVFGEKQESSCSGGLHFNPVLQVCDWPQNAGCVNVGEPEVVDPEVEEPGTVGPETDGPTTVGPESESGEGTEWLENGCPADFHIHWLLPHESDCGKFYYCVHGQKQESSCSGGLHFNPVLQVCDWPQNAGCANVGEPEVVDPEVEEPEGQEPDVVDPEGQEPDVIEPEAVEPDVVDPEGQEPDVEPEGQEPDVVEPEGQEPDVVEPEGQEPDVVDPEVEKPDVEGPGTVVPGVDNRCFNVCNIKPWPHKTDCDKFWRCEGNKPILVICPEGLLFNASLGSCDFSCNAGCVGKTVQTTANDEGLKIFVPWHKIDDNMRQTLSLL